jgi:hypothetical protein
MSDDTAKHDVTVATCSPDAGGNLLDSSGTEPMLANTRAIEIAHDNHDNDNEMDDNQQQQQTIISTNNQGDTDSLLVPLSQGGIVGVDEMSLNVFNTNSSNCADVLSYARTSKANLAWVRNHTLFLYNDLRRKRHSILPVHPAGIHMDLKTYARACALSNAALFIGYQVPITYPEMMAMFNSFFGSESTLAPMAALNQHRILQRPAIGRSIVAAAQLPYPFETQDEWLQDHGNRAWDINMQMYQLMNVVDLGDRSLELIQAITTIFAGVGLKAAQGLMDALAKAPMRVNGVPYPEPDFEKPWVLPGPSRLGYFEPSILTGDDEEHTELEVHSQLIANAPHYAQLLATESEQCVTFLLTFVSKLSIENFLRFRKLSNSSDDALPTLKRLIDGRKSNLVISNILDAYEKVLVLLGNDYVADNNYAAEIANHYGSIDGGARLAALIRGDCWGPGLQPETWLWDKYDLVKILRDKALYGGRGTLHDIQTSKYLDVLCDMFSRGNQLLIDWFSLNVMRVETITNICDAYDKLVILLGDDYAKDDYEFLANYYGLDDAGARITALIRGDCWAPGFPPESWRSDKALLVFKLKWIIHDALDHDNVNELSNHLDVICDMFSSGNKQLINAFLSYNLRMNMNTLEEELQLDSVINDIDLLQVGLDDKHERKRPSPTAPRSSYDTKRMRGMVEISNTENE